MSWTTRGKGLGGQDEHRKAFASLTGRGLEKHFGFAKFSGEKNEVPFSAISKLRLF